MSTDRYDIIIIGTGAGGGTLLHKLAPSRKRILVLERGGFLPREKQNWDPEAVITQNRYHTKEVWKDGRGRDLHPGAGYWVGGNTKVYGGAIFRFRERDFERVVHKGGISPEWPLKYRDFEPYYAHAEQLYDAHGAAGEDPTEPTRSGPYPHPPVSHEPELERYDRALAGRGLKPFHVPLAIKLKENDPVASPCIRCATCDGYPCLVDAKADADVNCVRPSLRNHFDNVRLLTEAKVVRLLTSSSGREVTAVEAIVRGKPRTFSADLVVVSCGAINSAALLLRSANDRHPRGLANGSDQVGRNFMRHQNAILFGISTKRNPTVFQKTLAINDFYWGERDFPYPMGHVSLVGKSTQEMLAAGAPPFVPGFALRFLAEHAVDWWLTGEDLPDPNNRVRLEGDAIALDYTDNNTEGFDRLIRRWKQILREIDGPIGISIAGKLPLAAVGHQNGTVRFGTDPKTSVLDVNCRAHEVANLYVVDASFFPSSAAVNPSLTIMANALRVGERILEALGASAEAPAAVAAGTA
jgi:choline dehydrogenase-like flavoprotein